MAEHIQDIIDLHEKLAEAEREILQGEEGKDFLLFATIAREKIHAITKP